MEMHGKEKEILLWILRREMRIGQEQKQTRADLKIKTYHGLWYRKLNFTEWWQHPELNRFGDICLFHWVSFSASCTYLFSFTRCPIDSSTCRIFHLHHFVQDMVLFYLHDHRTFLVGLLVSSLAIFQSGFSAITKVRFKWCRSDHASWQCEWNPTAPFHPHPQNHKARKQTWNTTPTKPLAEPKPNQ